MVSFRITPLKQIALVLEEGDPEMLRASMRKNFPNAETKAFAQRLKSVLANAEEMLERNGN